MSRRNIAPRWEFIYFSYLKKKSYNYVGARMINVRHLAYVLSMMEWKEKSWIHNYWFISKNKLKRSSLDILAGLYFRIGNKWEFPRTSLVVRVNRWITDLLLVGSFQLSKIIFENFFSIISMKSIFYFLFCNYLNYSSILQKMLLIACDF